MNSLMGLILTGGPNNRLRELAQIRSASAIPVGGKYRAIDFPLSNMVNSGITNVGVITQYSFRSLMDHLGSGKEWDLDRRYDGLFIFPPAPTGESTGWYKGTADAMYHNLTFLERSNEEFVIIAQGNCVYNMKFNEMLEEHLSKNADITIAYSCMEDYSNEELSQLGIIELDEAGRITDFKEKPLKPNSNKVSMGIYIIKRELLIALLEESAAHGDYDFVKDILIKKIPSLNICGYQNNGYWRAINNIPVYYRCNMELLDMEISNQLFREDSEIYTKVKDEAPAKYNEEAEVKNSIIADGCIIEGTVENSVIFRGVTVKKGVVIKNCIIMQSTVIEEKAHLEYIIIDKDVTITQGKNIKGEINYPVIIEKGAVV